MRPVLSTYHGIFFVGIITRQEAEELLEEKQVGTFLVRVSERIWGYAISFRADNRCKHFLIDTSDGAYQFFGTNQLSHEKLADLVNHHKVMCYFINKPQGGAFYTHYLGYGYLIFSFASFSLRIFWPLGVIFESISEYILAIRRNFHYNMIMIIIRLGF